MPECIIDNRLVRNRGHSVYRGFGLPWLVPAHHVVSGKRYISAKDRLPEHGTDNQKNNSERKKSFHPQHILHEAIADFMSVQLLELRIISYRCFISVRVPSGCIYMVFLLTSSLPVGSYIVVSSIIKFGSPPLIQAAKNTSGA